MSKPINLSIDNEMWDKCRAQQRKGNIAYKWINIFRRGYMTLGNMPRESMQDDKIERLAQRLDFYIRRSSQLEGELQRMQAERR
jgi:hypothetical protein